jgi:general secretion pathway protein E
LGSNKLSQRFGELLIAQGKLEQTDLDRALRLQESGESAPIGTLLMRLGIISELTFAEALACQLNIPLVASSNYPDTPLLEDQLEVRFLKESKAIPLATENGFVDLAMINPLDKYVVQAIELTTQFTVRAHMAVPQDFDIAFERLYDNGQSSMGDIVDDFESRENAGELEDVQQLKELASEAPVIRLVNLIIRNAMQARASDIHIEPFENRLIVRYRVDGVMHEIESPPQRISAAIISRIKIMANLDIAERRLPQDGRIMLRIEGKELDLRVSTLPILHGESVVMRILDRHSAPSDIHTLGFDAAVLEEFIGILKQPHGIILVTGPTGSGKTTTLHTALRTLNQPDVKILTVEDPVEYQIEGINQIQARPQIGLTFANALRSIVRQDPDIIMIGEIRDLETAEIAVRSALTGHLVLSTVHTNDAPGTVNRLIDMGVEDYMLTSTLIGVLAQRLVRTLCTHCRELYDVLPETVEELELHRYTDSSPVTFYRATGCDKCGNTGFRGRESIVELFPISDRVRSLVMNKATAGEIRKIAMEEGMRSMFDDGVRKAITGTTTIDEVLRVTREE